MCVCVAVSRVRTVQRYSGVRCRGEREGGSKSEAKGKTEREHRICLTAPLRRCLRLGSTRGLGGNAVRGGEASELLLGAVAARHEGGHEGVAHRVRGVVQREKHVGAADAEGGDSRDRRAQRMAVTWRSCLSRCEHTHEMRTKNKKGTITSVTK